jgi:DNA repair photolyase
MRTTERKTLLYKTHVEYGDYALNHVEGCAHGCKYPCYALLMARRFGRVKDYQEWIQPKLVTNALQLLDAEINRVKSRIKFAHLCFTTDPFMVGYPEVSELSLRIIEKLNVNGIKVRTLTKGLYPEVLSQNGFCRSNEYGITLVSVDESFREEYEPNAATYAERIDSLRRLHDAGLKTWVSIEPYPTPNIIQQSLRDILNRISFADRIVFGELNYNTRVHQYRSSPDFYTACSADVIDFCKTTMREYYIKSGTDAGQP